MISCILLTAGESRRFGSPKALAPFGGTSIIEHLQETILQTKIHELIIVLGAHSETIEPYILKHKKIKFVYNKDYKFGQTSSFKTGLRSLSSDPEGIVLWPIDYPLVKRKTIDALIDNFYKKSPMIVIPSFDGKKGHPPIFPVNLKNEILQLENTAGLNTISHKYAQETIFVDVQDIGVIKTFNTQTELDELFKHNG